MYVVVVLLCCVVLSCCRGRLRDVSKHLGFVLPIGICLRCNKTPLRGRPSMVVGQGKKTIDDDDDDDDDDE